LNGGESDPTFNQLMLCAYEQTAPDGRINIFPFRKTGLNPGGPPALLNFCYDIEWPKWSWAYTMWTGLTGTSDVPRQLNIKYIAGFEINPQNRSILNSQTMTPAMYDPTAIETAAIITQSRQDCMPASYNAEGDIGSALVDSIATPLFGGIIDAIAGADSKGNEKKDMNNEIKTIKHRSGTSLANAEHEVVNDTMVNGTLARDANRGSGGLNARFGHYQQKGQAKKANKNKHNQNLMKKIMALEKRIASMQMAPRNNYKRSGRSRSRARSQSRPKPILKNVTITKSKK
jgi:hypothetical protein